MRGPMMGFIELVYKVPKKDYVILTLLDEVHCVLSGVVVVDTVHQEVLGELPDEVVVGCLHHVVGEILEHVDEPGTNPILDFVDDHNACDDVLFRVSALVDLTSWCFMPEIFPLQALTEYRTFQESIEINLNCRRTCQIWLLLVSECGIRFERSGAKPDYWFIRILQKCASLIDTMRFPTREVGSEEEGLELGPRLLPPVRRSTPYPL